MTHLIDDPQQTTPTLRPGMPYTELSGFEVISDEERALQQAVHKFAADVLRPAGTALDRLSADETVAPGSPIWEVFGIAATLGLDADPDPDIPAPILARIQALAVEELGWGDAGLAVSLGVSGFPLIMAKRAGNAELIEMSTGKIGCWIGTQPDRGSDGLMIYPAERNPKSAQGTKGNLTAKVSGGDIIINGQTSAWVSNGPIAQVGLLSINADYGDGLFDSEGHPHGIEAIVPLDLPGITRGKALEKLGKRAQPQGEIYFDNVKIPIGWALTDEEHYWLSHAATWSTAGVAMGQTMTGLARAAFEHALDYAHTRRQGGALIAEHQLVQHRLGLMARKVEMMRAFSRRATEYTYVSPAKHPYFTASSKAAVTDLAFEVADEALQIFGGNGLTKEYPVEKLFRDARAARIEDGENHVLTMRFGYLNTLMYQNTHKG